LHEATVNARAEITIPQTVFVEVAEKGPFKGFLWNFLLPKDNAGYILKT